VGFPLEMGSSLNPSMYCLWQFVVDIVAYGHLLIYQPVANFEDEIAFVFKVFNQKLHN
jgi:hypothetical protein